MKKASFKRKKTEKIEKFKQSDNFEQYFDDYLIKAIQFKKHLDNKILKGVMLNEKKYVNTLLLLLKKTIELFKSDYLNKNNNNENEKEFCEKLDKFIKVIEVIMNIKPEEYYHELKNLILNEFEKCRNDIKCFFERKNECILTIRNKNLSQYLSIISQQVLFILSKISFKLDYYSIALNCLANKITEYIIIFIELSSKESSKFISPLVRNKRLKTLHYIYHILSLSKTFTKDFYGKEETNILSIFSSFGWFIFENIIQTNRKCHKITLDNANLIKIGEFIKERKISKKIIFPSWKSYLNKVTPLSDIYVNKKLEKYFRLYFNLKFVFWKNRAVFTDQEMINKNEICRICENNILIQDYILHIHYCKEQKVFYEQMKKLKDDLSEVVKLFKNYQNNFLLNSEKNKNQIFSPTSIFCKNFIKISQSTKNPNKVLWMQENDKEKQYINILNTLLKIYSHEKSLSVGYYEKNPYQFYKLYSLVFLTIFIYSNNKISNIISPELNEIFSKFLVIFLNQVVNIKYIITIKESRTKSNMPMSLNASPIPKGSPKSKLLTQNSNNSNINNNLSSSIHLNKNPSKQSSKKTFLSQEEQDFCALFLNYKSKLNVSNKTGSERSGSYKSRRESRFITSHSSNKSIIRPDTCKSKTYKGLGFNGFQQNSNNDSIILPNLKNLDDFENSVIDFENDEKNEQDNSSIQKSQDINSNSISESPNNSSGDPCIFFGYEKEKTKKSLFSLHSSTYDKGVEKISLSKDILFDEKIDRNNKGNLEKKENLKKIVDSLSSSQDDDEDDSDDNDNEDEEFDSCFEDNSDFEEINNILNDLYSNASNVHTSNILSPNIPNSNFNINNNYIINSLSNCQLTNLNYEKNIKNKEKEIANNELIKQAKTWRIEVNSITVETDGNSDIDNEMNNHLTDSINDFTFIIPIAKGGYGRVDIYKKKTTGDKYAIKTVNIEAMKDKNLEFSLKNETTILNEINSDYIVNCYYIFKEENYIYYVMEYMKGGDLFSLLSSVCLLKSTIQLITAEVILSLIYLHSKGIVHRDIKPENILIGDDGHFKLTDFGLSDSDSKINKYAVFHGRENSIDLLSGGDLEKTENKKIVGTLNYMAPENFTDEYEVSFPVDYWALGILIYELYTFKVPFNASNSGDIKNNIINMKIDWSHIKAEEIRNDYDNVDDAIDLINKFLVKNPEQRWGDQDFEKIKRHKFFEGFSWVNIKEIRERYIIEYVKKVFDQTNKKIALEAKKPKKITETVQIPKSQKLAQEKFNNYYFERVDILFHKSRDLIRKQIRTKKLKLNEDNTGSILDDLKLINV